MNSIISLIEEIKNPSVIVQSTNPNLKVVMYVYADAYFTCDCGCKHTKLTQHIFGNQTYTGQCVCGKKYELLNGKFKIL